MDTTQKFCRAIQRRYNKPSAYGLAKLMNVSNQTACNWVNKDSRFSTESAIKCAQLLSLSPTYVVACVNYEKEKTEKARQFWQKLAQQLNESEKAA